MVKHTTYNNIWSTLIKSHQDISELTTYYCLIFKKLRKPIQKWHNYEDKYPKLNSVKENNPIKLWVLNAIYLTASPHIRFVTFIFIMPQ